MPQEQTDTIIGAQVELKGSLQNHGAIQVFGTVIGEIFSDSHVIIGEGAVVEGPITAKQIEIAGHVHGTITAEVQIELLPKSVVRGDLITSRLSVRPGAVFIGSSKMVDEHQKEFATELPPGEKKRPRLEVQ